MSKTPGLCDCFCLAINGDESVLLSVLVLVLVRALGDTEEEEVDEVVAVVVSRDHSFFCFPFARSPSLQSSITLDDCNTNPWDASKYVTAAAMFAASTEEPSLSDSNSTLTASAVQFIIFMTVAGVIMPLAAAISALRAAW